jgi:hypothetical protein
MSASARDAIKAVACGENVSTSRRAGAPDQAGSVSEKVQPVRCQHAREHFVSVVVGFHPIDSAQLLPRYSQQAITSLVFGIKVSGRVFKKMAKLDGIKRRQHRKDAVEHP